VGGDADLFDRINALSREEETLYAKAGDGGGLDGADVIRLEEIQVQLDQVYDLLHQRQGRGDAGRDPAGAHARAADVVEGYQQ
jgi:Protein of unknown function (DUF2630)